MIEVSIWQLVGICFACFLLGMGIANLIYLLFVKW